MPGLTCQHITVLYVVAAFVLRVGIGVALLNSLLESGTIKSTV